MTEVIKVENCRENIGDYDVPIYKAIIIPKGVTNGDMIKAMFPNGIKIDRSTTYAKQVTEDWWNAQYIGADRSEENG
jgi:hypothetical protein